MRFSTLALAIVSARLAQAAEEFTFTLYTEQQGKGKNVGSLESFSMDDYLATSCIKGTANDKIWSFQTQIIQVADADLQPLTEQHYCIFTFGDNDCDCVGDMYPIDGSGGVAEAGDFKASALSVFVSTDACPEEPPCPFNGEDYKGASFSLGIDMTE